MKELLKVQGMSCGHCEARVKNTLSEIDGVNQVIVNLEEGTVEVDYEDRVSLETIKEAIDEAGYDVV